MGAETARRSRTGAKRHEEFGWALQFTDGPGSARGYGIVPKTKLRRQKHVPQRTCVGCRQVESKRTLIRVVRSKEGVKIDPTGKEPGRGAYLHDQKSCWDAALRGSLARTLRTEIQAEDRQALVAFMDRLNDK